MTNPIIATTAVKRFRPATRTAEPREHSTLVYRGSGGEVYNARRPPTRGEMLFGGALCYEVDTGRHPVQFACSLPSRDQDRLFQGVVHLTWQVTDPAALVSASATDAEAVYGPPLMLFLRDRCGGFAVEQSGVEAAINAELAEWRGDWTRCGISLVECTVEISLDEATSRYVRDKLGRERQHAGEVQAVTHDSALTTLRTQLALERAEAEQTLRQQRLDAEQELEKKRRDFEHRQAAAAEAAQIALKQTRMQFYSGAMKNGKEDLLVLQLTEHPQDVTGVLDLLLGQERASFENNREILLAMLNAKVFNAADLDDTRRNIVNNLLGDLNPPSVPSAPPTPLSRESRSAPPDAVASSSAVIDGDDDDDDD